MPTCDSAPQPKQWLDVYSKSDVIFTYCDWARDELRNTIGEQHKHKVIGSASPVAAECFFPKNKVNIRQAMGIGIHETVFGTVMRNQKRKLYPQLFKAFRNFLDKGGDGKLICHTSYPDKGWDFQLLLKQHSLSDHVLFTYKCIDCDGYSLDSFNSVIKECSRCKNISSKLCTVDDGIKAEELSNIYSLMDLYIQPCTNEGFGMPIVEAAACGVPIAATNYSAPKDIVHKLNGTPLDFTVQIEPETGLEKAIVDHECMTNIMLEYYNTPKELIALKGIETRKLFEKFYSSWAKTGQKWDDQIQSVGTGSWDAPISIIEPNRDIPPTESSAFDISTWIIRNTLCDDSQLYTYQHARLIRDLSLGFVRKTIGGEFNRKLSIPEMIEVFANKRIRINEHEYYRQQRD
jgi:glycosyltransferase involved in cell wall biosynthesis